MSIRVLPESNDPKILPEFALWAVMLNFERGILVVFS